MRKMLMVLFLVQGLALAQTGNGSVAGRVLGADGKPAINLPISAATQSDRMNAVVSSRTDASGNFHLENIPPGNYYIVAAGTLTGFGSTPLFNYYPGVADSSNATMITISAEVNVVGIDFTLPAGFPVGIRQPASPSPTLPVRLSILPGGPGVKVSGRVVLAPGTPQVTAGTIFMSSPRINPSSADIRPDGTFEFSGVPPGSYLVEFRSGNITANQQITVAGIDVTGVELADLNWVRNSNGLQPIWSLSGQYSGIAWDADAALIHVASGRTLVDLDRSGRVLNQIPFVNSPNLRLAHFAKEGAVLLSFGTWSSSVDAYDLAGKRLWSYTAGGIDDVWAKDLDGDGSDEVIVGFNGAVGLHVLDSTGKLLWMDTSKGNNWHVAAGDVLGEGRPQVVNTSVGAQFHIFSADGKQHHDLSPGFSPNMIRTGKVAASDPADTIFVGGTNGNQSQKLAALSGDGTIKWSVELMDTKAIYSAYLAPGKPWLALGSQGGAVKVVDTQHGTIVASIDGQGFDPEMTWVNTKDSETPLLVISTGNKLNAYRVTPAR